MTQLLEEVRRGICFAAGLAFWLNAFFLVRFSFPPLEKLAAPTHLTVGEALIISALVIVTVLRSYGLRKFASDMAYIYFFPFIFVYYVCRTIISVVGSVLRVVRALKRPPTPPPLNQTLELRATPVALLGTSEASEKKPQLDSRRIVRNCSRFFLNFTLLWCLLVAFATHRPILEFALFIVVLHLCRSLFRVRKYGWRCYKWLGHADEHLKNYFDALFGKLGAVTANGGALPPEVNQAVTVLVGIRSSFKLLRGTERLVQWFTVVFLWCLAAVYVYLATLFSLTYYGVARLEDIPLTWSEALVTSFFLPALVSTLPRNPWLYLVGGIQWFLFTGLGVGALFTYFGRRIREVVKLVDELSQRLEGPQVRTVLDEHEKRMKLQNMPRPT